MSGLVGWADFQRDLSQGGNAGVVHAMTETMRDRGPDGKGVWLSASMALGHRKLSAGDQAEGEQPALAEVGADTIALAYDGAIYNLPELRREVEGAGARLRTGSDTDILLQCYLLWGTDFVARLNGMFAFALWDGRARRLLLGRDRMGVKPLFYAEYPGGILFASLPKGIIANPLFEPRLELSALPVLLQPRLAMPGETPLAGLREVPPAHVLEYSPAGLASHRYWRLHSAPHSQTPAETADHIRMLLGDIVSRQLPTAGPCAAMLSGGVDSTAVAALAAQLLRQEPSQRQLGTFCVRFDSDQAHFTPTELRPDVDAPYAAAAAEYIGSHHRTVTVSLDDLTAAVPATRQARDLPGWGQFDASMYLLFQYMRQESAVALSGEAADEFFGGYPYLFDQALTGRDTFAWLGDGPRLCDYLSPEVTAVVDPRRDERDRYAQVMSEVPRLHGEDPVNARMREVLFAGMAGPLASVLDRKDRMSMAHGLQVRVPFCDHRLVEYAWNVPWPMKCSGGLKGLLKAAVADLVPPTTLTRKKSAYPHVQNPDHDQALVREATWVVNDPASAIRGLFDTDRLNGLLRRIGSNELTATLPGGASGAQFLIQLAEMRHWIDDYQVALP
ncbi:MAG TPA: asparagine synthase (glutamine-hydrolyzing) [Streptosporangiaceae bacterium]|nr:asparagine synthase (glutamine-hydrolyzing) [Streptosporangiaceae bacterium]